ncbi:hypothetical protein ACFWP3_20540 [Streptomyces sp. NPDC058525]|uniref:hypothetical protein n=1 Tax=Streptomyces sp. NPDC058525 TaxID=3346538 RepID=UPI00365C8656
MEEVIRMTRLSRRQHLVTFSASAFLTAGGVLAAGPASSAPAVTHTGTAATVTATVPAAYGGHARHGAAVPAVEWVEVKDPRSGITAELPGKATVQESSAPVEGKTVTGRSYYVDVVKDERVEAMHERLVAGIRVPRS